VIALEVTFTYVSYLFMNKTHLVFQTWVWEI